MTTEQDVKVDLKGLTVDAKLWERFLQLPEAVRRGYMSTVLHDCIFDILDNNPALLAYNMRRYGGG